MAAGNPQLQDYQKLGLLPELISTCDVLHLYDNTIKPFRIFKKRKDQFFYWENDFWDIERIQKLTGIAESELVPGVLK